MANWKLFALIAVVSIAVASGESEELQSLKLQRIVRNSLQSKKSLSEALETPKNNFDNSDFRLPNNTRPTHYNLHVRTEIHSGNFAFDGVVRINITVLETSDNITIHSRDQNISQIILTTSEGANIAVTHSFDNEREFLIISTSQLLQQGQELLLEITFAAELEVLQNRGFIRLSAIDPVTNLTTWLAASHYHPINSRHGYPCYDEVRFRSTYQLSIYHHASYNAIANTRPTSVVVDQQGFATTTFEETPPIPAYIIAYTISPFTTVNTTDNGILFQVLARPEAIAAGQLDNSLEIGVQMMNAMVNLFNIPYSLSVSTQFAAPGFDGAHNWGLVVFNENSQIQLNDDPIAQHRREMGLGHEYSHIYFANLVSPEWWTYLWLNEGLATFYENVLNDIVFPEKVQWERFLIEFLDNSMENDIYDLVEPMNRYVETIEDIRSRFNNFISYQKAALVLRTFQQGLGDSTWTKGVGYYLVARSLNSATAEDFYIGLRQAIAEDYPPNSFPDIADLMHTWVNFAGYPVVTVSRNGSNLVVTQEGFRTSHQELFGIPLTYATASSPDFDETIPEFWLTTREMTISAATANKTWTEDDWVIFNLRDNSYYVTNYDESLWQLIIDALNTDHEAIHFLNRGTLYADLHRFIAQNYDIRASLFLDMMESLPLETNSHVWVRAELGLRKFEERLRGSRLHRMHMNYIRHLLGPVYGTEFTDVAATNIVNRGSCIAGVERCRVDALNALIEELETGSADFVGDYRCNGMLTANETVWRHFFDLALTQSANERTTDFIDLMCSTDREILRFFLDQTLDLSNNLQTNERGYILHAAAYLSEVSYDVLIEFIEDNHAAIESDIGSLENLLLALCTVTNTECQAERVLYLTRFLPAATNPGRNFFRSVMIPNLNFYDANFDSFHEWYDNFEARTSVV